MAPVIHGLIDPKKKEVILQRIKDGKTPFCADSKPASEPITTNPINDEQKKLNHELIMAAVEGSCEDVKALIRRGADVNARGDKGTTPLMMAADRDYIEMVKLLIESGADVYAKNDNGLSVLAYTNNSQIVTVDLLRRHGAIG